MMLPTSWCALLPKYSLKFTSILSTSWSALLSYPLLTSRIVLLSYQLLILHFCPTYFWKCTSILSTYLLMCTSDLPTSGICILLSYWFLEVHFYPINFLKYTSVLPTTWSVLLGRWVKWVFQRYTHLYRSFLWATRCEMDNGHGWIKSNPRKILLQRLGYQCFSKVTKSYYHRVTDPCCLSLEGLTSKDISIRKICVH